MDEQGGDPAATGGRTPAADFAPDDRRDRRRSRTEWQRQQYRVAESGATHDNEARSHEPEAGDA